MDIQLDDRVQSILPDDEYVFLLGVAAFEFARLNGFVVENLGYVRDDEIADWYRLIDQASGCLVDLVRKHVDAKLHTSMAEDFLGLVQRRNRIMHGFAVTDDGKQMLWTKTKHDDKHPGKGDKQFIISKEYLRSFSKDAMDLEYQLDAARQQLRG